MTCNRRTALNEMKALLNDAWQNSAQQIVGYTPDIRWPMVEEPSTPDMTKFFARFSTQTVLEGNAGIGDTTSIGTALYNTAGLLFVQLFGPMSGDAQVGDKLEQLAALVVGAYRGITSPSGVWFRNVRNQELTPDSKFQRRNVVAEFQYYEIG